MTPRKRHTLVLALLGAAGLIVYFRALTLGFVWDDNFQIVRNPFLHSDQPISRLLLSDVWGYMRAGQAGMSNYYRPLQMLTYRWTAAVAGLNPAAYHATGILLNILACCAAYLCLWQLTKRFELSAAAAILFAIHPIHSEAVLWIAALTELGCAFFYFLAFWLFLLSRESPAAPTRKSRHTQTPSAERKRWLIAGSCASAFIALLWKEMALTFPVVVGAYVFFFATSASWRQRLRDAVIASIPFWVGVGVYAAMRVAILGYFAKVQHALPMSRTQFIASGIELIATYWVKLVLPLHLNAFHVFHPPHSFFELPIIASLAFLVLAAAGIIYGVRRAAIPSFAALWVFITLVPVLNLQGIGQNAFTERYLYIPSLGFVLLVAWLAASLARNWQARTARIAALVAVIVIALASTGEVWARIPDWKSDRSLYVSTVRLSPDAALIRNSLAQLRRDEDGDLDGAQRDYEAALAAAKAQGDKEQVSNSYVGLAGIASRRGHYQEGLEYTYKGFDEGAEIVTLHVSQGILLMQLGRIGMAKEVLEQTNKIYPYDEVVHNSLGAIAMAERDYGRAISEFQIAIKIQPGFADAYNNLGRAYSESGNARDSIQFFERAVSIAPNNPLFLTNLGVGLAREGRYAEARDQLQRALQIDPNFPAARANLDRVQNVISQAH